MGLKVHSVVNGKTPKEEYAWLQTDEKINLTGYALVDRTFNPKGVVSNEFRHIFIFPDLEIEKSDWVRLYSGEGKYSKVPISDGSGYIHSLYWQAGTCVWNNAGGDTASLIKYGFVNAVTVPAVR